MVERLEGKELILWNCRFYTHNNLRQRLKQIDSHSVAHEQPGGIILAEL